MTMLKTEKVFTRGRQMIVHSRLLNSPLTICGVRVLRVTEHPGSRPLCRRCESFPR